MKVSKAVPVGTNRITMLRWRAERFMRRMRSRLASRFFRDIDGDPKDSIIVAGVARSGTTWLAEVLRSQAPLRIMFEPFHSRQVPGFKPFPHHTYRRVDAVDDGLRAFTDDVLSGRIRHPHWVDRQVDCFRPSGRIVKDIRICLFLRWIRQQFPEVPILFIIRHPCAVVASLMKLGWSTERDLASILYQPELREDFLGPYLDLIQTRIRPHERHTVVWCVNNLVPLRQFQGEPLNALYYEDLVHRPSEIIPRVFEAVGLGYDASVFDSLARPSRTVRRDSAVVTGEGGLNPWRSVLTDGQAADVLDIVNAFGLDYLYTSSGEPSGAART